MHIESSGGVDSWLINQQITDNGKEVFLMSGVSTKYGTYKGKNGFYAVLNLTVVYKRQ